MRFDSIFPFVHRNISQAGNLRIADQNGQVDVSKVVFVLVPYDLDNGDIGGF